MSEALKHMQEEHTGKPGVLRWQAGGGRHFPEAV